MRTLSTEKKEVMINGRSFWVSEVELKERSIRLKKEADEKKELERFAKKNLRDMLKAEKDTKRELRKWGRRARAKMKPTYHGGGNAFSQLRNRCLGNISCLSRVKSIKASCFR